IWLNEGFATYMSGLVVENLDGQTAFKNWKSQMTRSITSAAGGAVFLTDADTLNVNRIFNQRLSYNKGAMLLHMLRKQLGDAKFFEGLQTYLNHPNHAYGYATSEDFIGIMEQASAENLSNFFEDWLYGEGYPEFVLEWSQDIPTELRINL